MRKAIVLVAVAVALLAFPADAQPLDYIVVLRGDGESPELVAREHGIAPDHTYRYALRGFAARIPSTALERIKRDPRVAFVSEDREVSIAHHRPWHQPSPSPTPTPSPTASPTPTPTPTPGSQVLPTGVDRINAERKGNTGAGIQVAVIDTGIDLDHPDLMGAIVGGKNCQKGSSFDDGNGHGTHVAGTIAARDNGLGVVGVAPDAKLWAVRVLNNSGSGTWSSVICGVDFVTSKAPTRGGPITVANMSLGGYGSSDNDCGTSNNDALHKAICKSRDAGVTYVVAAGNESDDAGNHVPAAYDDAVITVSALEDYDGEAGNDVFANFSNYGNVIDIAAPGVAILSTWKGGSYNTISGTSMATPHVAGAAALYLAANPGFPWTAVRDALRSLGEPLGLGHSDPSGLHPEPVVRADAL